MAFTDPAPPNPPPPPDTSLPPNNNTTKNENGTATDTKAPMADVEKQEPPSPPCCGTAPAASRLSAFSSLGFLDRFLAAWIFLAMLLGILLGNFVDDVGPALQKGTFVGVSIPIGMSLSFGFFFF